jgi:hypothetical protein
MNVNEFRPKHIGPTAKDAYDPPVKIPDEWQRLVRQLGSVARDGADRPARLAGHLGATDRPGRAEGHARHQATGLPGGLDER